MTPTPSLLLHGLPGQVS